MNIFSVDNIAFTILNYPLSYIELIGTIFYLLSVWLIVRRNVLTWPIGIVSVILYMILFYQIRLYADAIEQVYYLFASVYGWWVWQNARNLQTHKNLLESVFYSTVRSMFVTLGITLLLSIGATFLITQAHILSPLFFPEPASYPFLDALTTVLSFTAMWLTARKRVESWFYWIIVDIIGVGLYFVKDVRFISALYVVLLIMAIRGLIVWHHTYVKYKLSGKIID